MRARLLLAAAAVAIATVPATSAHAFVCSPSIRPVCDTVCSVADVCRLFG
jgi:uncharacterized protein